MKYAILGDLHSSTKDTKAVLKHIQSLGEDLEIIGLGDLFECKVGKKKLATLTDKLPLDEVIDVKPKFDQLLTFPSVIGNQEERIAFVTGNKTFLNYPQEIVIEHALIKHGHQFDYTEDFELITPTLDGDVLFFGHSHYSAIYIGDERKSVVFDKEYAVGDGKQYIVNVGCVIDKCEWCLYDSSKMTVTFKKAIPSL